MAVELSNITFTDQADVFPASGVEAILNTGIANILAGDDIITGTGGIYSILNAGTLNTADGNDTITGISQVGRGIVNYYGSTINTGRGDDIITGTGVLGLTNGVFHSTTSYILENHDITTYLSLIDTGEGNDIITGIGINGNLGLHNDIFSYINTGEGNDIITGIGGILNQGNIHAGNNNDSIIAEGDFITELNSLITTGEGNDIITSTNNFYNYGSIFTEGGDDIITINGNFYNGDSIYTGSGRDSFIVNGDYLPLNHGGIVYLQEGEDYLKGFFEIHPVDGGDGEDTLELPPGTYDFEPGFISYNAIAILDANTGYIMETYGFEKLRINNTTYDFPMSSVQGIVVT
jgi:hypothetical protein